MKDGVIDVVVTSAGALRAALIIETALDDWNTVMGVNVTGTYVRVLHVLSAHGSVWTTDVAWRWRSLVQQAAGELR